jgi:metal-dependent amidase/aminoacylase/carboxypeptidase family protein
MSTKQSTRTSTEATVTTLSAYEVAKLANLALTEAGVERQIPPQMVYNYTSGRINKGKAPLIPTVEVEGKVRVTEEAARTWVTQYVAKQVAKATTATDEVEEPATSEA